MSFILQDPEKYPSYCQGLCKNEVDIHGTARRRLEREGLERAKLFIDRARHPAGRRLMIKTKIVHNLQAQYWLKVEKLQVARDELETIIARRERHALNCREQKQDLKKLVDEMETLKQDCNRQLLHNRKRIARHRSDLQAYSAKSDEIQEKILAHKALTAFQHPTTNSKSGLASNSNDDEIASSAEEQSMHRTQALAEHQQRNAARLFSQTVAVRKHSSVAGLGERASPTHALLQQSTAMEATVLNARVEWNSMAEDLKLEGAYHLQDLLYERGVRTRAQLAKMTLEHVRSLACSNPDKSSLINATRTARERVAAAKEFDRERAADEFRLGTSGDGDVALLTSRRAGGFLPLFTHRVDQSHRLESLQKNVSDMLKKAINDRNAEMVQLILSTEEGREAVNTPTAEGWTVLQRVCMHKMDITVPPKSAFASRPPTIRGPFEHAPWLNVFGRATLETTQRIQAAEAARKMVVEPASPSTPAADLLTLTGMSGLSATNDTPTFLDQEAPSPCKLRLHSICSSFRSITPQSNLQPRELQMQEKNTEIVKQLLKARADVHLKNSYGRTALHYAAMEGNLSACRTLIEAGALPDELDKHGFTPVQHCVLMKRADWDFCHDLLTGVMVNKPTDEEILAMSLKSNKKKDKKKKKK